MREELRVLNALIGMAVGVDGWPSVLSDAGYRFTGFQNEIRVTLNGEQRQIVPEGVFQSLERHWVLLVESKSATFHADQADRYLAAEVGDVVIHGAAQPDAEGAVGVVYFCHAIHADSMKGQIEFFNNESGTELPLVDYENHRFLRTTGRIGDAGVDRLFESGIYFRETNWPSRFVPYDSESPPEEMSPTVIRDLIACLLNETIDEFDAEAVIKDSVPFLDRMGRASRQTLLGKVAGIVEDFRASYLGNELLTRSGSPPRWTKGGRLAQTRHSTLHNYQKDYLSRLQNNEPLPRARQSERLLGEQTLEESGFENE